MELFEPYELRKALMDLAEDIRENYVQHLIESKHYTTEYTLIDSVRCDVEVGDRGFNVVMTLKDYWKYLEEGTKPHFPPLEKIREWIEIKPILPRPVNGIRPTKNQLAYLIGRKIAEEGTKGTHDLSKTEDAVLPMYSERLSAALRHDVERYILKVIAE